MFFTKQYLSNNCQINHIIEFFIFGILYEKHIIIFEHTDEI